MCKRIYKEQTSEQGDVPFFKIGTFGADPDAFISNELFDHFKRTYPYPTQGTLLISAAGSIGRVVEYQGEKAYFQDSNIVWLEHDHRLNDAFLKPLYSQIEWGLEGSTIKRLYNKDLLGAEVTIPGSREQKEIGRFFAKLDSLITLHQRMCPIFCFCAHGLRTDFASILQGLLRVLRYPRPVPKMIASPSAPASGVFDAAGDAFVCGSSSAGVSLANTAIEPLRIFCTLTKASPPLRYR